MRSSFAILALTAFGAYARPQESVTAVQPITQISDGQIQAPPATAPPASYGTPSVTATATETAIPTLTDDVETMPTVVPGTTVSPPVESSQVPASSIVVVVPTGSGNATVSIGTPTPSASEAPEESATGSETAPGAPEATGAATANMASMGALALAVLGMVFA